MNEIDELEDLGKYCYRTDNFNVSDPRFEIRVIDRFKEYFLVAGEHSSVRVLDLDLACCFVEIFDKAYYMQFDPDDPIGSIAKARDLIMVYDYVVTELRKLDKKETKNSPLFEIKTNIEEQLLSGEVSRNVYDDISREIFKKLDNRAQYLAHAYKLEWDGVISLETCKKFDNIADLDAYIKEKDLIHNTQSVKKRVNQYSIAYIDYDDMDVGDLLKNVRPLRPEFERYYKYGILKNEKLLRLEQGYAKSEEQADKLHKRVERLILRMNQVPEKSKTAERLRREAEAATEKMNRVASQIVYIK